MKYVNKFRNRVGYFAAKDLYDDVWQSRQLTLIAVSPTLFNRPIDWEENLQVSGFLSVPEQAETWSIPGDLKNFIDAGDPPIYMTFGSVVPIIPQKKTSLLVDAARAVGCRAIICSDWDRITGIPEHPDIYRIGKAPYLKIFPHCAAVVHHGGAGTTYAVSLAGCPSIIVHHLPDQIFWGVQLKKLGIAPNSLNIKSVTSRKLSKEIRKVLNSDGMKNKAQDVGKSMQKEDGVERAVKLIEKYLVR